ncbi:Hypothetical predicted protein, partial [Pelobates cultripes]
MAALEDWEASKEPQRFMQGDPSQQLLPQGTEQSSPGNSNGTGPATKQDIRNLLKDVQKLLAADIEVIEANLQVVTDRVHTLEEDIVDIQE